MIFLLTTLFACTNASEECITAKEAARAAWGELAVKHGLELAAAEDALKEPTGRLAALERRPDAPAEGKAALAAEVAAKQAAIDAVRPKVEAAQTVAGAFAGQKAADAKTLAVAMAPKLAGPDVDTALQKADAAVAACEAIE